MNEIVVIAHNIRSTHNVGSIFRTADAMGVSHVYLSGYTPTPTDRFGRPQKDIAKTALGAETYIPWERAEVASVVSQLQKRGFTLAALEQSSASVPLNTYKAPQKLALILGNEVRGVSKQLQEKCDVVLEIPMFGEKESLNVSVAAGIALFMLRTNT